MPEIAGPEKFVSTLWSVAEKTAERLGVPPQVLLAQAALETAWGRSMPSRQTRPSAFLPAARTSPPTSTQRSSKPAANNASATRSTA